MSIRILDDFSSLAGWSPFASGQAQVELHREPGSAGSRLRLDFDFRGEAGFVGFQRAFDRPLPPAYSFHFRIGGDSAPYKLEFKVTDRSRENVWRWEQESFPFVPEGTSLDLSSRQLEFAWGPDGGGTPRWLGSLEFVLNAGSTAGGRGSIWLEDLRYENRSSRQPPTVTASSGLRRSVRITAKGVSGWTPASTDQQPWLQFDFHRVREYGGVVIDWRQRSEKRSVSIDASDDGEQWRKLTKTNQALGKTTYLPLTGGESRYLRLRFQQPSSIRRLEIQPFDFSRTPDDFLFAIAKRSPRGWFPRPLLREQSYWTCTGVPDGNTCALLNEDGLAEPDRGSFSIEPFLYMGKQLISWAQVRRSVRLAEKRLPIPTVLWRSEQWELGITLFATGEGDNSIAHLLYRLRNRTSRTINAKLFLALRPHQVSPPWQHWQSIGGIGPIHELDWRRGVVRINQQKVVVPHSPPDGFGACTLEQEVITARLAEGELPAATSIRDQSGLGMGALRYDVSLAGNAEQEFFLSIPFGNAGRLTRDELKELAATNGGEAYASAVRVLQQRTGSVEFRLPTALGVAAAETFQTAAGQMLINRDGNAIQPGPRRYTRSWIRDGVIMGTALLRSGDQDAFANFLRWYAPFQREDGFVPCCVDRNGADWLVEHDSHGQLIYGVAEVFRFLRDRAFLRELWPFVRKAADFITKLRKQRLTSEYQQPQHRACRGLLPESASHEGYLAQPVHSYWDDFWALRGLRDAVLIAIELDSHTDSQRWREQAADLERSLTESLELVIADKGLDYVPGSVEWADYDPTATANAIEIAGTALLPPAPLRAMFELFVSDLRRRRDGEFPWKNYSAYEIRIIGALVRLGMRNEAVELLQFYLNDRRPRQWNQWPEISWRKRRTPGHLGDLPHTWIGAEFMLSFTSLLAYECPVSEALIVGAGIPGDWLQSSEGVSVQQLPTRWGPLNLKLRSPSPRQIEVEVSGLDHVPPGGIRIRPPLTGPIIKANDSLSTAITFQHDEVVARAIPIRLDIRCRRSVR
ncbi:discoidin domain-containing protein [Planctomicrobium sp. SH664]|uniref:discoidin domain-containing protein n=1 Tax=Planctomicrobium sp. SH664 TaxID=3448125 RepID=UPI003F5B41EA